MSRIIGFITKFAINSKELQLASINDKSTFSRTHTWYIQQLYPADDMFCECLFMTLRSFKPLIFVDILYKFYNIFQLPFFIVCWFICAIVKRAIAYMLQAAKKSKISYFNAIPQIQYISLFAYQLQIFEFLVMVLYAAPMA